LYNDDKKIRESDLANKKKEKNLRNSNMKKWENLNLGISFRREHAPERLPDFAQKAEEAGFDEIWVTEDCFYAGGIASATAALASTKSIAVGVGIMPAVVRNPVFTAMEIAALARLYPGRFLPGIGHGVARWMRQIGEFPKSQLTALEETAYAVRELLAGNRIDLDGEQIQLEQAQLVHPPDQIPPVYLGVRGPKSLALSGRISDGTILAEFSSPAYVAWAREQIAEEKDSGQDHHVTVFIYACACASIEDGREQVRQLVAKAIASSRKDMHFAPMGILEQIRDLRKIKDPDELSAQIPGAWIDQLAVIGNSTDWKRSIKQFAASGANTVVLVSLPGKGLDELDVFADQLSL
jgi:5,10-methylenetetrahydromethanopterin reductase